MPANLLENKTRIDQKRAAIRVHLALLASLLLSSPAYQSGEARSKQHDATAIPFAVARARESQSTVSGQGSSGSCAPTASLPANALRLPLMRQATDYTCGVAALQSILVYWGEDVREDRLARALKADRHNGTAYKRIVDYARAKGYRVDYETGMTVDRLKSLLDRRRPVICLIQAWSEKPVDYTNDWSDGHYVVALGYDRDNFYFMDPSTAGHYTFIPISSFVRRWHDIDSKERLNHFGMAVSKPDAVPEASRVTAVE